MVAKMRAVRARARRSRHVDWRFARIRTAADDTLRGSAAHDQAALLVHRSGLCDGRRRAGGQDGGEVEHRSLDGRSVELWRSLVKCGSAVLRGARDREVRPGLQARVSSQL